MWDAIKKNNERSEAHNTNTKCGMKANKQQRFQWDHDPFIPMIIALITQPDERSLLKIQLNVNLNGAGGHFPFPCQAQKSLPSLQRQFGLLAASQKIVLVLEKVPSSWTSFINRWHKSFHVCRWKVIYLPHYPLVCSSITCLSAICSNSFCLYLPAVPFPPPNPQRTAWIDHWRRSTSPQRKTTLNKWFFSVQMKSLPSFLLNLSPKHKGHIPVFITSCCRALQKNSMISYRLPLKSFSNVISKVDAMDLRFLCVCHFSFLWRTQRKVLAALFIGLALLSPGGLLIGWRIVRKSQTIPEYQLDGLTAPKRP